MTLDVDAFLRRFLLHVVPRGFMRIRHFGLLANRTRRGLVRQCRDLLGHPPPADAAPESAAVLLPLAHGFILVVFGSPVGSFGDVALKFAFPHRS